MTTIFPFLAGATLSGGSMLGLLADKVWDEEVSFLQVGKY